MNNCKFIPALKAFIPHDVPNFEASTKELIDLLLASVRKMDIGSAEHCHNVAIYAYIIGQELKLEQTDLKKLYLAGLLHDVGKLGIPFNILFKPERLSQTEFSIVKKHSQKSANIISLLKDVQDLSFIIGCHHEHFDGSGYPNGLKGNEIPSLSRILAVADSFDAMVSERCYKKTLCLDEAVAELKRCSDQQFDRHIANVFIKWLNNKSLINVEKDLLIPNDKISSFGQAWVHNGQVLVKSPQNCSLRATIVPCPQIELFINQKKVTQPIQILAEDHIKVFPCSKEEKGFAVLHISEDALTAQLEVKSNVKTTYQLKDEKPSSTLTLSVKENILRTPFLTSQEIKNLLCQNGVVYGINEDLIRRLGEFPYDGIIEVAKGRPAKPVKDGFAEPCFNNNQKEIGGGVGAGETLVRLHLAKIGIDGIDVFGKNILVKKPHKTKLIAGKNTKLDETGLKAISTKGGIPQIKEIDNCYYVSVIPAMILSQDINEDISFEGQIHILGCVENKVTLTASEKVYVANLVTNAVVKGKEVVISGNITCSQLFSEETIKANCAFNSLLKAKGDVFISKPGCFQTTIETEGDVHIDGVFIGGSIKARQVFLNEVGAVSGIETLVFASQKAEIVSQHKGVKVTIGAKKQTVSH